MESKPKNPERKYGEVVSHPFNLTYADVFVLVHIQVRY